MTYTRFDLTSSSPSLWRVTFHNPPINLIDSVMIRELGDLIGRVERDERPAVLIFDSADPQYFLAHYDITPTNRSLVDGRPKLNRRKAMREIPATSCESDAFSKDLKGRGFRFVGSTIVYAHMQAIGMVNDHLVDCFRYRELRRLEPSRGARA